MPFHAVFLLKLSGKIVGVRYIEVKMLQGNRDFVRYIKVSVISRSVISRFILKGKPLEKIGTFENVRYIEVSVIPRVRYIEVRLYGAL